MKNKKFILIGDGKVAENHRAAIRILGGQIINVYDPFIFKHVGWREIVNNGVMFYDADYTVICSPTFLHREHIIWALNSMAESGQVIVEKPMILPGEDFIDDDRINIVMQYRWMPIHRPIKRIRVRFIRDDDYYKSWKGDHVKTGGYLFNLFIHYLDLAYIYDAEFEGDIRSGGEGFRLADDIDLSGYPRELLYLNMYQSIDRGYGVKPRDMWPLWDYMVRRSKDLGSDGIRRDGMPFYFFHI